MPTTRRSFMSSVVAAAVAAPIVRPSTALAAQPIQPDVKHTFWRHDGGSAYSNTVDDGLLTLSTSSRGMFAFSLEFTPTQDEVNRLIQSDPTSGYEMTHVLLTVKYFGITPRYSYKPEIEFRWPGVSEYARVGGATVSQEDGFIAYNVISLDFGSWEAGRSLEISGSVGDCSSVGPGAASVEVWLQPCRTWTEGVTPEHEHWVVSRSQDGKWKHYASLSYGEPSQLYAGENRRFYF